MTVGTVLLEIEVSRESACNRSQLDRFLQKRSGFIRKLCQGA